MKIINDMTTLIALARAKAEKRKIKITYTNFDVCLNAPEGYVFKQCSSFGKFGDSIQLMSFGKQLLYQCSKLGGPKETLQLILDDLDHIVELESSL